EVLEDLHQLVVVPSHESRSGQGFDLDGNARRLRNWLKGLCNEVDNLVQLYRPSWRDMHVHFNAAERKQVVYEPGHALCLSGHDAEEPIAGFRIVARRALQRLDKAAQRREWRAQLVARMSNEIGPHLREPFLVGDVPEGDELSRPALYRSLKGKRGQNGRDAALHRHAVQ